MAEKLMKISLKGHGIHCDGAPGHMDGHWRGAVTSTPAKKLVTGRFFVDVCDIELWVAYQAHFADKVPAVINDAETICRHEFNLLGSGVTDWGNPIDWHIDPVSGYRWPQRFAHYKAPSSLGNPDRFTGWIIRTFTGAADLFGGDVL